MIFPCLESTRLHSSRVDVPNVKAGTKSVSLTDSQLASLGLTDEAEKLGCGRSACAYLPSPSSDSVVKITKDQDDALTAYILTKLVVFPQWAIPIYAVYRLPKNSYVVVTAKAEPLPADLVEAFDRYYDEVDDDMLNDWYTWYKESQTEMKRFAAHGEDVKRYQVALEAINEAIVGLRDIGMDWADFHSGNWMMYNGRPVLVDFGAMSKVEVKNLPVEQLNEAKPMKQIPVLQF